ncbi:G-protein-coupled receptor family protein [Heterostelium album PN500]|uniref:G-protein-coupled receptor family protein n=1 Tax=Heterostelium pallidum (strain ATCC 26659 / Pp 5 / PN500) TaxID=670386 RepID=D3BM01_HETP5|nr:G-protein-coupled receptor family protein [Heterostelium album PN500]EFA77602.1 G-protein-coupled receptor family protein [Heterostelium album PN500]|eukprot:XP_020429730.1 G-protein-coupled receptor family protein [Heterostelium album PN500]
MIVNTTTTDRQHPMDFTIVDEVTGVLLYLSLIGAGLTIITYLIFPQIRTYPIKLIIYLCLSLFLGNVFLFISYNYYDTVMCIPSAILVHYLFISQFLWTFCVSLNFYQMIVRKNRGLESYEKYYHLISWGIPLIIVVVLASTNNYVQYDGYCYMAPDLPIFYGFFVPGMIILISNCIIFFLVAREISDTLKKSPNEYRKNRMREFRVYFSIFATLGVFWIFSFLGIFVDETSTISVIFQTIVAVTAPTQGLLIFITYCINRRVFYSYVKLFSRIFPALDNFVENMTTCKPTTSTTEKSKSSDEELGSIAMSALRESSYRVNNLGRSTDNPNINNYNNYNDNVYDESEDSEQHQQKTPTTSTSTTTITILQQPIFESELGDNNNDDSNQLFCIDINNNSNYNDNNNDSDNNSNN